MALIEKVKEIKNGNMTEENAGNEACHGFAPWLSQMLSQKTNLFPT